MAALGKIAKTASPRVRAVLLGSVLVFGLSAYAGVTAAYSLHHGRSSARGKHRGRLFVSVAPREDTILAGSTAGYRIRIRRRWFTGPVRLRVIGGLPRDANARFSPRVTAGSRSTLTVRTSLLTAPGTYRLRVRARGGGRLRRTVVVMLVIGAGTDAGGTPVVGLPDYQLSGNVVDPLWPGMPRAIDVTITNPNPLPLSLTSLTADITNIAAPRATPALPCSSADFAVQAYSGPYPVVVPASSTATLQQLGIPSSAWPQVAILDLPTDQDGCQGASLTLAYSAQATLG